MDNIQLEEESFEELVKDFLNEDAIKYVFPLHHTF